MNNKKVLVVMSDYHYRLYNKGFSNYGTKKDVDVAFFRLDSPLNPSFIEHYMYKKNIASSKTKYFECLRDDFCNKAIEYDIVVFVNLFHDGECFIDEKIKACLENKRIILLIVDALKTVPEKFSLWSIFDSIYSLEKQDEEYGKKNCNIEVNYLPVGSNYQLYIPSLERSKAEYDICFVGISSPERLSYLNYLAEKFSSSKLRIFLAGHYWHNSNCISNFIGAYKFKKKYPKLYPYIHNVFILPKDLAKIYAKSRICLNINVDYHYSFNPRNFDIMTMGSLLIANNEECINMLIEPEKDFIMVNSKEEMASVIENYMACPEKYEHIQKHGQKMVLENYQFYNTVDALIGKFIEEEKYV